MLDAGIVEHVMDHRTGATRAIVSAVDDTQCAQLLTVQSHDGVQRQVEAHHPFGFTSNPPANGAVSVLVANGGDPSDMIALPAAVPLYRFGGLPSGSAVMYAVDGSRVLVQPGTVTIWGDMQVILQSQAITLTAASGIDLVGDVSIEGSLSVSGAVSIGGNLSVGGNITADGTITGH